MTDIYHLMEQMGDFPLQVSESPAHAHGGKMGNY